MPAPTWYLRLTVLSVKAYILGKMSSTNTTFELEDSDWDEIAYTTLNKYNNYKPNLKRSTMNMVAGQQTYTIPAVGQGVREFYFPIPRQMSRNVENPFYLSYATQKSALVAQGGGPANLIALDQWMEAMRNATGRDTQVDIFNDQLRVSPAPSSGYGIEYEYLDDHILGEESVKSTITIQDIDYEAQTGGVAGNNTSVTYNDGGTAGSESVVVTNSDIVVTIEAGVSTATQVKAAIDGDSNAAALVATTISGTAVDPQTTQAKTNLAGGVDEIETTVYPIDRDTYLDLALAYAKIKVGEIRRKHSQVSTGTVTIKLDLELLREGKEEAKEIEADLLITGRTMFVYPSQG